MSTILEKVKSVFAKNKKPDTVKAASASKPKRKVKKKLAPEKELAGKLQLKESIEHNGYYSISVKSLFKLFGFQQCRSIYFPVINNWMKDEGLYMFPSLTSETKGSHTVQIHKFPVEKLGDLFNSEQEMEDLFTVNEWYKQLNLIINPEEDRQFKPKGTRDKLDFKAKDLLNNHVVLELKHKGGDKRLIEQVFRYRSWLMTNFNTKKINCVIITGIRCVHTARAIHGLSPKKQKRLKWYLYDYKAETQEVKFKEVPIEFINKHFPPIITNVESN